MMIFSLLLNYCSFCCSGDEIVDLVADDLYVLRYKSIKALVEGGRVDLV